MLTPRLHNRKPNMNNETKTIETKDSIITFNADEATKQAVFDRVLAYYVAHDQFFGEGIHQCDETIIDAPNVMSDIADNVLKFQVEWKG